MCRKEIKYGGKKSEYTNKWKNAEYTLHENVLKCVYSDVKQTI